MTRFNLNGVNWQESSNISIWADSTDIQSSEDVLRTSLRPRDIFRTCLEDLVLFEYIFWML